MELQRREDLLSKEDREEHDTFDKRCKNDGEGKDVTSSTWVTAGGFSSLCAEKADADSGTDSSEGDVEVAGEFSKNRGHCRIVSLVFRRPPQSSPWSARESV